MCDLCDKLTPLPNMKRKEFLFDPMHTSRKVRVAKIISVVFSLVLIFYEWKKRSS
jgi:hypothetical protein